LPAQQCDVFDRIYCLTIFECRSHVGTFFFSLFVRELH
jgi:hypothetical protein